MRKRQIVLGTLLMLLLGSNANACWLWWHHCRHHWIEHHYAHHHGYHAGYYAYGGGGGGGSGNAGGKGTDKEDPGNDATKPADGATEENTLTGASESGAEPGRTFVSTTFEQLSNLDGKIENVSIGKDIKELKDDIKKLQAGQDAILAQLEALTKALAGE